MKEETMVAMEKDIREHRKCRNQLAMDIIDFLKEKEQELTFERAEKILLDTVEVLRTMSRKREI